MKKLKRTYTRCALTASLVLLVLLVAGSIWDLPISKFLYPGHESSLGQFFAVTVLILSKVQVIHRLCIQPGVIERRADLVRDRGQGLVLCRLGSGHFRFVNIRRVSGS